MSHVSRVILLASPGFATTRELLSTTDSGHSYTTISIGGVPHGRMLQVVGTSNLDAQLPSTRGLLSSAFR